MKRHSLILLTSFCLLQTSALLAAPKFQGPSDLRAPGKVNPPHPGPLHQGPKNLSAGPNLGKDDVCDYVQDVLCVKNPGTDPLPSGVNAELAQPVLKLDGEFIDQATVENLVDLVVTYDSLSNPLLGSSGFVIPNFNDFIDTKAFDAVLFMDDSGLYDVNVLASVFDAGTIKNVSVSRQVLRLERPDLIVTKARVGGTEETCEGGEAGCLNVEESGGPNEGKPADHNYKISPSEGGKLGAGTVQLCLQGSDATDYAGSSLLISGVNTVHSELLDAEGKSMQREVTIEKNCEKSEFGYCTVSPSGDMSFCPGGYMVDVPVADGENKIELFVNNSVTGYALPAGQWISLDPIEVDLKGPELCVEYYNENGAKILDADGNVILSQEAKSVTVDVAFGRCGAKPETVQLVAPGSCDLKQLPECDAKDPICVQFGNSLDESEQDHYLAACAAAKGGQGHYQFQLPKLRYPVTTFRVQAQDDLRNKTVENHAFGYGRVRALFDKNKKFNLDQALVPDGVAGFVDEEFIQGKVRELVEKVANTKKFKDDFFFKLLDPRQPTDSEISCLNQLENVAVATDSPPFKADLHCSYGHLASKDRVVALKVFDKDGIGKISVPDIKLYNKNRAQVRLNIKGWHGKAEMYTLAFKDSDGDGLVDTEDNDDDNDGIVDEDDADDDNDGHPDAKDVPGCLVPDPDFGIPESGCKHPYHEGNVYSLPVRFAVKDLDLNLDISYDYDKNGLLQLKIVQINPYQLVEALPDNKFLIEFDCDKTTSGIYQDGAPLDLRKSQEACKALKKLVSVVDLAGDVAKNRENQGLNQQFMCTFNAMIRCSLPERALTAMEDFETNELASVSLDLLDHKFNFDFYAPLLSADLRVGAEGIGFSGDGLMLSGGVEGGIGECIKDDVSINEDEPSASRQFLECLPDEYKTNKFGPLYPAPRVLDAQKTFANAPVDTPDAVTAAYELGQEVGLAIKEETINSAIHAGVLTLWDLLKLEGEHKTSLDLSVKRLRELGLAALNPGSTHCIDKNGDESIAETSAKCFKFELTVQNVFSGPLSYVDFDGDGAQGQENDNLTPLIIRAGMDPKSPVTARVVSATPLGTWNGEHGTQPAVLRLELELGIRGMEMSIFEERRQQTSIKDTFAMPNTTESGVVGTGEIKSWCDSDRYPGMNPTWCDEGKPLPIVRYNASGSVYATVLLGVTKQGLLQVRAGLSSRETIAKNDKGDNVSSLVFDTHKSYLQFRVTENNTIMPDAVMSAAMESALDILLPTYSFGTDRDIRLELPLMMPLEDFAELYPETDVGQCVKKMQTDANFDPEDDLVCEITDAVQDFWEDLELSDYGIDGMTLLPPVIDMTGPDFGPMRYLLMGSGVKFKYGDPDAGAAAPRPGIRGTSLPLRR